MATVAELEALDTKIKADHKKGTVSKEKLNEHMAALAAARNIERASRGPQFRVVTTEE